MLNIFEALRKLAKSSYYLNKLHVGQSISIDLFNNTNELSNIQMRFLSYLYLYKSINEDIASKKVSEKVLNNTLYEDSYMHWRQTHTEKINEPKKIHKFFGTVDNTIEVKEKKG